MKPRISRPGTLRAASAVCAAPPSFIGLPLLLGAFLTVLWLSAAPAQADALSASEPLQGLGQGRTLERVEEVAAPVTDTLGTVHQRLEEGTGEAAATATILPEPSVSEFRGEVRGVFTEVDRVREEATELGPLPTPSVRETTTTSPDMVEAPKDEAADEEGPRPSREIQETEAPLDSVPPTERITSAPVSGGANEVPGENATVDDDTDVEPVAEPHRAQGTTGSPAPSTGGPAPAAAVAGYLASATLPGPDSTAVLIGSRAPHAGPTDPADDPTVSPD
ncbi:hypothetical protein [Nocardiopsis sp. LDBS1602]|uniref:hypothetical protein n=1 Tax=Nocardiopsis sp. LDBS1602 TaxID=3109597 RepID=UPI002DB70473|nr:hypothetical protein [Nocardiopsis sp. LDBS1602]MEC3894708.1 hypothetical protein [Nocardiopsis sp. LDBS1602]